MVGESSAMASTSSHALHRIRFVDYEPSPITALQFAPLPLPSPDPQVAAQQAERHWRQANSEFGCLVVGRQNGQVDVWEYEHALAEEGHHGGWVLDKVLPATLSHPTVSMLALVIKDPSAFYGLENQRRVPRRQDLRLFTAGSDSGDLVERCLRTGRILQIYSVPAAPIWSLAVSPTHDTLVLASSSANLHFLSISADSSTIEVASPLHRSQALPGKVRTLSIAWGPPARVQVDQSVEANGASQWQWRNQYLVTGNSDSSLRKWSTVTGRITSKMAVSRARKEKRKGAPPVSGTIVWSVGVLTDHTIVSADSMGAVTFWDGQSQAQMQTFACHAADAMCLTVGPGGRTVYTSGPDQKIAQFTLVNAPNANDPAQAIGRPQWIRTAYKRAHVHDVRAIAVFPPHVAAPAPASAPLNLAYAPVLASGGWDMQVVLSPASAPDLLSTKDRKNAIGRNNMTAFSDATNRRLQMLPTGRGLDTITFSRQSRLILCRRYRGVTIWRLRSSQEQEGDGQAWAKVLDMDFQLRTSLTSAALSNDGRWLAVADLYETKLFSLKFEPNNPDSIRPHRVRDFAQVVAASSSSGAASLLFTPDSNRLIIGLAASSSVVFVELGGTVKAFKAIDVDASARPSRLKSVARQANGHTNGHANGAAAEDEDSELESDAEISDGEDNTSIPIQQDVSAVMTKVSDDGQWLLVLSDQHVVTVYNLDTLRIHARLPKFAQSPIDMAFAENRYVILALPISNTLLAYDAETRRFCNEILPVTRFHKQADSTSGIVFEESSGKLLAWGQSWIGSVPLQTDIARVRDAKTDGPRKRKVDGSLLNESATRPSETLSIVSQVSRQAAALTTINGEIVLVERPFSDLRSLPPAFTTAKYGQ